MNKRELITYTAALILTILVCGCSSETQPSYTQSRDLLGTTVTITINNADTSGVGAVKKAFTAMEDVNNRMNRYDPESELSRLNAHAGKGAIKVSEELFDVLKNCDWYSGKTYGAFDATVLPIIRLWDLKAESLTVPSAQEVAFALEMVGYNNVELNRQAGTVVLPVKGMGFDLGGIAKGFAVDKAAQVLRDNGVRSALVMGAGNIAVIGLPQDRDYWKIAVQHPREEEGRAGILKITSGAVATSGDYERFVEIEGKRYSHIVDPLTGWPVSNGVISVTVLAPTAQQADALSTAIFVMGLEKGMRFTEFQPAIESVIITEDESGKIAVHTSSGLKDIYESRGEEN